MTDRLKVYNFADLGTLPLTSRRKEFTERLAQAVASMQRVHNRGEPLDEIWWRGRQWAVTAHGLECLDGCYHIEASRLAERAPETNAPEWLLHMGEKNWVDVADFTAAFLIALVLHNKARGFRAADLRNLLVIDHGT